MANYLTLLNEKEGTKYGNFSFIEQIKLVTRVIYMHNWSGKIGNIYATMK